MYLFFFFSFFSSIFFIFKFFKKKILVLLFLELSLVMLISLNLFFSFSSSSLGCFFSGLIFLTFMVIDSVFGLSLLIYSSRNSTIFNNFFFSF